MASPNLIRWGGLAALLAGAFYIVEAVAAPFITDYHWAFHSLDAPAHALLAVGVVGLYLWQRSQEPFEWLGTVGVILIVTASVLLTLGGLVIAFMDGVLGTEAEVLNDIVHPLELVVMMGAVLLFLIAGLLEGLGRQLILDTALRYLVGWVVFGSLLAYFLWQGRR